MIIAGIIASEVAFWIVLAAALSVRYLAHRRRASTALLVALPLIDVALLAFVAIDLGRGAEPTQTHALAACYLGFTVAFGHPLVRWADRRFAHRVAGAALPPKPAKGSRDYVHGLWIEWLRVVLAAAIALAILAALAVLVKGESIPSSLDDAAENPLWSQAITLGMVVAIWFLAGPAFARRRDR